MGTLVIGKLEDDPERKGEGAACNSFWLLLRRVSLMENVLTVILLQGLQLLDDCLEVSERRIISVTGAYATDFPSTCNV